MRLLADMGVSRRVAAGLRAAGHDVVHLSDQGLQRLADAAIFSKASAERRTVLTFDLDFPRIAAEARAAGASVVLFRLVDATSANVLRRALAALTEFADDLARGTVVVVEDNRTRARRYPLIPES